MRPNRVGSVSSKSIVRAAAISIAVLAVIATAGAVGPATTSPHKGALYVYEVAPGGAVSVDPQIDYETTGGEIIQNVYQTLVTWNGSQTGPNASSFVPELATCVPGSAACESLYGSTLVTSATSSAAVSVAVGGTPQVGAFDSANGFVYVPNPGSDNVSVLSGTTVVGAVTLTAAPAWVTYDPLNGYVYVSVPGADAVSVVSGTTIVGTVNVGTRAGASTFDAKNGYVYVVDSVNLLGLCNVSVIHGTSLVNTFSVGGTPQFPVYDSANGYVYIQDRDSDSVSVVRGASVISTIPVGSVPSYLIYDSANERVYVTNQASDNVSVINGTKVVATVAVGKSPYYGTFDATDNYVYIANTASDNVTVINGGKVAGTVAVGSTSEIPAYDSSNGNVYVPNDGSGNVSVLNGVSLVGTEPVGSGPDSAVFDSANGYVYVANANSDNVSVVPASNAGQNEWYTFVLDRAARFYDPGTGASWPVYPSDVMFSVARDLAFTNLPTVAAGPGWILAQALLPEGNPAFDSGIHAPYDNSPENILDSMLVNSSTYCPAKAMSQEDGCITFNVDGVAAPLGYFLELLATPDGSSIVPCGPFTAVGAAVPGFVTNGRDAPCSLPGDVTKTSAAAFQKYVGKLSPTSWDSYEEQANDYPAVNPAVQYAAYGSGPYYLEDFTPGFGYVLEANPAYHAPSCPDQPTCGPAPGSYAPDVNVIWESNDSYGIAELKVGQADFAGFEAPQDTPQMAQLAQAGVLSAVTVPSFNIEFDPFTLDFNVAAAQQNDTAGTVNVPANFFAYDGLRQFLVHAWPYTTVQNEFLNVSGITLGTQYGGAIPAGLGDYYPTNVSWPSGNPNFNVTVVDSAAWYWSQANSPSSALYDPELANCNATSPCTFPIVGETGATQLDSAYQLYIAYIEALSGGALVPNTYDVSFLQLIEGTLLSGPGQSPFPIYTLGWAPDYPDPTDYVTPMYYPDETYTSPDAVAETLSEPAFMASTCADQNPSAFASLAHWAGVKSIPTDCQGTAYSVAVYWMQTVAAHMNDNSTRALLYNMAEHIMNNLALYVYYEQQDVPYASAPWVATSSINENPMVGGEFDQLWYNIAGTGLA